MRLLLLLGLCALAASRLPNPSWLNEIQPQIKIEDEEFRSGREYRYNYNGQLATGVPGTSKQHSATRIQAIVSLVFRSGKTVLMQLTHVRMGKLNQYVPSPRDMIPFEAYQEVPVEPELQEKLFKPVKFIYEDGLIKDVEFDGAEEPWSANIKRGIMNMIQVNMKAKRRTDTGELTATEIEADQVKTNVFFTSTENTLEGECETATTITRGHCQPYMRCQQTGDKTVMNVTKSINFQRCTRRPDIKYNFRFQDYCPSCEEKFSEADKLIESSTIIRMNVTGNRNQFLIESCKVDSQYTFAPFSEKEDTITTYVKQYLRLLKSGPVETNVPMPQNPIESDSDLIFTPDWDILKEEFFQKGEEEFLRETPYSEVQNKVEFVKQILRRLVSQMADQEVKPEAPRQFARLVKILRMCKRQELEEIMTQFVLSNSQTQFNQQECKIIKDLIVDALGVCGSQECVKQLVEKTKRHQINPIRASMAIKSLVNIRVPSKEIIDEILSICEEGTGHEFCSRNPFLKQTVYLTAGSVMNALCAETPDKLAKHFKKPSKQEIMNEQCPRVLKERYVQLLVNKFKQTTSWYTKVLMLKAIGNSGIDICIHELEKIIKNIESPETPLIRKEAILALRQLRETMPKKIQKILMPIFMNKFETPSVRIVAVYEILQTQPEKPILDQIAKKLATEKSRQVESFIFSYSYTLANSTDPCEKKLADNLKQSLRHAKGVSKERVMAESFMLHKSLFSTEQKAGISFDLAKIMSNHSVLPKVLSASLHGNMFGFWQKYLATVTLVQEDTEDLVRQYLSSDSDIFEKSIDELLFPVEEETRESPRDTRTARNELKNIFRQLNIENRRQRTSYSPKSHLSLKLKDQDFAILPLSLETMPQEIMSVLGSSGINIRSIMSLFRSGINFNAHTGGFLQETTRKIPTSMGLPLVLTVKIPTVASINGELKIKMEPENRLDTIKTQFDLKPSFVSTMVVKMEAWSPIVNNGLKSLTQIKFHLPLKGKVEVTNIAARKPRTIVALKTVESLNNLLTIEARPVTYTRVWPKFVQTWQEPQEITVPCEELKKISTYDEQIGEKMIGIKYRLRTDFRNSQLKYKIKITNEPGLDAPKEVVLKLTPQSLSEHIQSNLRTSFDDLETLINEQCETECEYSSLHCEQCRLEKTRQNNLKAINYAKNFVSDSHTKSQLNIELFTKGSPSNTERKVKIQTDLKCGSEWKLCHLELNLLRTPVPQLENQPWRIKCEGQSLMPNVPGSLNQVDTDKKYVSSLKCNWGSNEQDMRTKFIQIQTKAQQSLEQMKELEYDSESRYCRCAEQCQEEQTMNSHCQQCVARCSPVSQYERIARLADLCRIDVECTFGNIHPVFQNVTNKVFRALKYNFYPESDVNQIRVRNPENKIWARITVEPNTHKYVNVTIKTPRENTKLTNIEMKQPIMVLNSKVGSSSRFYSPDAFLNMITPSSSWELPVCKVRSHKIVTFDQTEYRAPLTTCYSVLAKDCSSPENSKFAVLMKKLSPESESKKIKIITQNHVIEMEPETLTSSRVKVTINGEQVVFDQEETRTPEETTSYETKKVHNVVEHGHVIVKIEKLSSGYVRCVLPEVGIKVYFDGYSCNIKMSPIFRAMQCGLCGQFDSESGNEFMTARMTPTQNIQDYYGSYLLKTNECEMTPEEQERIRNIDEFSPISVSSESEYEFESDEDESREMPFEQKYKTFKSYERTIEPRLVTKVLEHQHELCFSKQQVKVCPRNSYATSHEQQQKQVVYACLNRNSHDAELKHEQALRGEHVSGLESLTPSFTETEPEPIACRKL